MAVLSEADRFALWRELQERMSRDRDEITLTKHELRQVIDAIDDWVNANAASFNAAIPSWARTVLTARQKAELLLLVVRARFGVS